jgi:hypothetical protein
MSAVFKIGIKLWLDLLSIVRRLELPHAFPGTSAARIPPQPATRPLTTVGVVGIETSVDLFVPNSRQRGRQRSFALSGRQPRSARGGIGRLGFCTHCCTTGRPTTSLGQCRWGSSDPVAVPCSDVCSTA